MSARKELHVLLRGVDQLRVPGRSDDTFDVYCILSCGHQQHRSRLIEHTAAPDWNEEFVFDGARVSTDEVIKLEIYNQGLLQDELLLYAYLELSECAGLDDCPTQLPHEQQQQQQPLQLQLSGGGGSSRGLRGASYGQIHPKKYRPSTGSVTEEEGEGWDEPLEEHSSTLQPSASKLPAAGGAGAGAGRPSDSGPPNSVARMSEVTTQSLALLSAAKGSGGSSSSSRASSFRAATASSLGGRSSSSRSKLSALRLKRSTHVRSATDLVVSVWWVLQPPVVDTGVPPCVLSFVHAPGVPHALPSATHTDEASLWEEPCLAFVRLVVSRVALGPAAAAVEPAAAAAADAAAAAAVGSSGGGGSSVRQRSKDILRRMAGLLKGEAAATEEVAAAVAAAEAAATLSSDDEGAGHTAGHTLQRRPTLRDIHGAGSLAQSFRVTGGDAGVLTQWDWQALLESDSDDDASEYASTAAADSTITASSGLYHWGLGSSSSGQHTHAARRSSGSGGGANGSKHKQRGKPGSSRSSSKADKQLYLSIKIQLGEQEPQALNPVPLNPDGSADVRQAAVFAVLRPLEEAAITYQLGLQRGARGSPLLVLVFQYSLLHLLRRSPQHSYVWEDWKAVARCTVSGLQVPLPVLPLASLDLSAFLADADCRAGMYQVPPVSAAALAAAAADDAAAAAAAAAEADVAAAAAAAAAAAVSDSDASLTDSEDGAASSSSNTRGGLGDPITYDFVGSGSQGFAAAGSGSSGGGGGLGGGFRAAGVLRRRMAGSSEDSAGGSAAAAAAAAAGAAGGGREREQRGRGKHKTHPQLDKWRNRVLSGVEAGLNQAMDRLPDNVAQKVKGRLINRIFPGTQRSEVFAIGQLRALSQKPRTQNPAAAAAAAANGGAGSGSSYQQHHPQQSQQQPHSPAAAAASTPSPFEQQQQQLFPRNASSGLLSAKTSAEQAAAAAAAAQQAAQVVPLQEHPNVAVAGDPAAGPLGVLQLTVQAINLRKGSLSAGYSLLLKSGPHWLELCPSALPLTIYASSGGSSSSGSIGEGGAWGRGETNEAPPVQVLIPVYSSSCLVALVLHRRSSVVGRCVFRLYGLLPLLLRGYTKSLVLYSDKRGQGGARIVAGSVLLHLIASPGPSSSRLGTYLRLACGYLVTPYTLSLHTSGVLESLGRDERAAAAGRVACAWLAEQGQAVVPDSLVRQLVSTGRSALSTRSMKGHVRRIKAVLLDWLPRRVDPLAFYYWRRPLHNLLALWVLSHACLYPGQWLLAVALLVTGVLLWHVCVHIRHGVLGFEMEQLLPPELGASMADLQQQQQQGGGGAGGAEDDPLLECGSAASGSDLESQLRSSGSGQLGERQRYKEAAERIRGTIAAGKQELRNKLYVGEQHKPPPAPKLPASLAELREQLEAGTLNLDALDIEAAAQQLLSVGGVLKLARKHSSYMLEYALVLQNLLDDAAGFAEGLYAMATAQDPLASLLLCGVLLSAAGFCYWAGLGAGVWVLVAVLLRPPLLRGVPGVFGWKAILAHLRGHGRSLEELAW